MTNDCDELIERQRFWRENWRDIMEDTRPMTEEDRAICRKALNDLHAACGIAPPRAVVFVDSPFVAVGAAAVAAACVRNGETLPVLEDQSHPVMRRVHAVASQVLDALEPLQADLSADDAARSEAAAAKVGNSEPACCNDGTNETEGQSQKKIEQFFCSPFDFHIDYNSGKGEHPAHITDGELHFRSYVIFEPFRDVFQHTPRFAGLLFFSVLGYWLYYEGNNKSHNEMNLLSSEYIGGVPPRFGESPDKGQTDSSVIMKLDNQIFHRFRRFKLADSYLSFLESKGVFRGGNITSAFERLVFCAAETHERLSVEIKDDERPWATLDVWRILVSGLTCRDPLEGKMAGLRGIESCRMLAEHSGPRISCRDFAIISDRPEWLLLDEEGRPHAESGPWVRWRDGTALYAWHGQRVPAEWLEGRLPTPAEALAWRNSDERSALFEIIGWPRLLEALDTRVIEESGDPLWGRLLEGRLPNGEAVRLLDATCGTGRRIALPVPPETQSVDEAQSALHGGIDPRILRHAVRRS